MDNVTEQLEGIVSQKGYISLSQLKEKLGASLLKQLALTSKSTAKQFQERLTPYLGERLVFRRGGRYEYLVSKISDEELLYRIVTGRSGKTPGVIGMNIPFGKKIFLEGLNRLLEKGRVRVKKLSDSYLPTIEAVASLPSETPSAALSTSSTPAGDFSEQAFRSAYQELARGRLSVRIYDLRRHLSWPHEAFDAMVKKLRDNQTIQLQAGETVDLTLQDIEDAFRDENGFLMLTCIWWE